MVHVLIKSDLIPWRENRFLNLTRKVTHEIIASYCVSLFYFIDFEIMEIQTMGLQILPVSAIRENPVALRAVNRESEDFQGLVDSIKTKGFLGAITVRARQDSESGADYYELIDGLQRFNAAKDAGLEEIKCDVVDLNDDEVLEAQIMANIHKVETRPVEYSNQLRKILSRNPLMTEAQLGQRLGKSGTWISQRLGLNKVTNENLQTLINEGKIVLTNAFTLAKLPEDEQAEWADRAITMPPDEFIPLCNKRIKEIREAKRKGADAAPAEFSPVSHLRRVAEIKTEYETGGEAAACCDGLTSATDGFKRGLEWVLHLDPNSVADQKAKDEQRKADKAEAKARRDAAKEEKKRAVAAEAAASLV